MNGSGSPNTFSFTCSDLIQYLRFKLHQMIEEFGDLFLPNLEDSILLQFMSIVLNGHLNAYYVDVLGFLSTRVLRIPEDSIRQEHLTYLEYEIARPAVTSLAARATLPSDWLNRPPERQYRVDVLEEKLGFKIVWTV